MPGSQRVAYGNELFDFVIAPTSQAGAAPGTLVWSAANGTNQTVEVTTTINGLLPCDAVDLYLTTGPMTTGLTIANIRVSAANTLAVTWVVVGSAIVFPTTGWLANITRSEYTTLAGLPTNAI